MPVASGLAADPAFVGVLALTLEKDVVKQLDLSSEVQEQLAKIVEEGESKAGAVALDNKDLPLAEQVTKLAPLVAETEKAGMALLSEAQRQKLEQIRIKRGGITALADEQLATKVGLDPTQREKVAEMAQKMAVEMGKSDEKKRQTVKAYYERQMMNLLTAEQRAAWEKLAGASGVEVATGDKPSSEQPAAEKPTTEKPSTPATRPSAGGTLAPKPATVTPGKVRPREPVEEPEENPLPVEEREVRFNFKYTPWKDVLEWFAEQADLSLVMNDPPQGTFNYSDRTKYKVPKAIDLLNGILQIKGFTLLRRDRMLVLVNLEDGIPPRFVDDVLPAALDKRGEHEVVSCLFELHKITPEEAEVEVRKLIGPLGNVIVLSKSRQLLVQESAGRLRTIRAVIQAVENPLVAKDEKVEEVKLQFLTPAEFLVLARPLLGISDNANNTPDGSLKIAVDELGGRLLVTGKAEKIEKLHSVVTLVDAGKKVVGGVDKVEEPQLEIYPITGADPQSALAVISSLIVGQPNVRMALDPKTGSLIAQAPPSVHATIRATLDQMQREKRQIEVIKLRRNDPQQMVLTINKLFGGTEEGPAANGPKVDADTINNELIIRGSAAQMEQIKSFLAKKGEDGSGGTTVANEDRGNVRMIPLTGRSARVALDQLEQVWGATHRNQIRVVTPSSLHQYNKSPNEVLPADEKAPPVEEKKPAVEEKAPPKKAPIDAKGPAKVRPDDRTTRVKTRPPVHFVSQPGEEAATDDKPAADPEETKPKKKVSKPGSDIVVTVGPNGIVIASEDTEALDEFETLLRAIAESTVNKGREFNICYLKYAKADAAAELLQEALGAKVSDGGGGGGGGGLLGDMAANMLGGGDSLIGGLLGLGGGGGGAPSSPLTSGAISILPDMRLNALIVQANARDMESIEMLLEVIDKPASPEKIETIRPPRPIKVNNTKAEDIATLLRSLYSSRMAAEGGGQQRQPTPQEFLQAMRGGGGRGGQQQKKSSEEQKITIGIDARTNSLLVSAPDHLFEEIKGVVADLDKAVEQSDQAVKVVNLKRANADMVQRSITSVFGDTVTTNRTAGATATGGGRAGGTTTGRPATGNRPPGGPQGPNAQDAQNAAMMQMMMQQGGRGGGGAQGGGGRGGGGFGGGGPGGGGFGGGAQGGGRGR